MQRGPCLGRAGRNVADPFEFLYSSLVSETGNGAR
jgi:hypothetical protein